MGAARPPTPLRPPAPPDIAKAQINALAYAETERQLRRSSGRKSAFLTGRSDTGPKGGGNMMPKHVLGM